MPKEGVPEDGITHTGQGINLQKSTSTQLNFWDNEQNTTSNPYSGTG